MMNILINDVGKMWVEYGMERGDDILTNTGACQGDCLLVIFFIIYLAKAIETLPPYIDRSDYNKIS